MNRNREELREVDCFISEEDAWRPSVEIGLCRPQIFCGSELHTISEEVRITVSAEVAERYDLAGERSDVVADLRAAWDE